MLEISLTSVSVQDTTRVVVSTVGLLPCLCRVASMQDRLLLHFTSQGTASEAVLSTTP